jgi:hypothetical protein
LVAAVGLLAIGASCSEWRRAEDIDTSLDRDFYIQALGNRCVDFGGKDSWAVGQPVVICPCNESTSQRVRVREIDDGTHDVELWVGTSYCIGVRAGNRGRVLGRPLELQLRDGSSRQRFALDGDAILFGGQISGRATRDFVVEMANGVTVAQTPLVIGTRDVVDAEYFRFRAADKSDARPHSGFVTVSNEIDLDHALGRATWGTVIEINDAQPIRLSGDASKTISAGVTLRGYRKHTYQGPELFRCSSSTQPAFDLREENVRLTGFRLRGPVDDFIRCPVDSPPGVHAIKVYPNSNTGSVPRVLIDHLDIGYWNGSGIDVSGPDDGPNPDEDDDYLTDCPEPPLTYPRETSFRAVGNFLHHLNPYGAVTGAGAFMLVQGNVMYDIDHHGISSDGAKTSGYLAYDNLFLSPSGSNEIDVHGSLHRKHWYDGIAGNYYDIGWNTILGIKTNDTLWNPQFHFKLRGTPCRFVDLHHNIFRRSESDSIASQALDSAKLQRWDNSFDQSAALDDLGVGDFDGDGIDDVFVGSGAVWYFSSGGQAEWRFLNRMPEKASDLRFGDFDADRRTDVLTVHNGEVQVSWAGGSPWQSVNVVALPLADLAVGDFNGDRQSDLFLATGAGWFVAPGARNWAPYSAQPYRTSTIRFGDLTGDGKTDVVAVVGGRWRILTRHSGVEEWINLHPSLSGFLGGVVAFDFTGDGKADLARSQTDGWWMSSAGMTSWTKLRSTPDDAYPDLKDMPVGRFYDGNATADVVIGSGVYFDYASGGRDPVARLSRQAMR